MKHASLGSLALSLLLAVLAPASLGSAQATFGASDSPPLLVNFQGLLTDSNGTPLASPVNLTFALYDAQTGGNILWEEDHSGVPLDDGYFNVVLGSVTPLTAAVLNGPERWMQVAVNGGPPLPRQRLTSVPYAVLAQEAVTAASATSVPWSGLTGVPTGLDDGDNDTTYSAGTGLSLSGTQFGLDMNYTDNRYWRLEGNAGTDPAIHFLGTTDGVSLTLAVSSTTALRLEPTTGTPNLIGGYGGNNVTAGVPGATIGGGGASGRENRVISNFGTVGGGFGNVAGDPNSLVNCCATIGGGANNTASERSTTVAGGTGNTASGRRATVGGGRNNSSSGNHATGAGAVVGGGGVYDDPINGITTEGNQALGTGATIAGGAGNQIMAGTEYGFIGGGYRNVITTTSTFGDNSASTIAGGDNNTASVSLATIGGGSSNIASNYWATVGGGQENEAAGNRSTIGGGTGNLTTSEAFAGTVPGGLYAKASHYGEMAYASGRFSATGDAQTSVYVLRQTTSGTTSEELFLNGYEGTSNSLKERITIASNRAVAFDILAVGRSSGGESAGYRIVGLIENTGGNTAFIGTPTTTVLGEDDASWDVVVIADNTNDALVIQATGGSGDEVRWVATVRTAEVNW